MKRSEQIGDLVAALAKAQGEFTQAVKDTDNPYYGSKYADLNAVISAVRPALNKHGIFMTHDLESDLERQCAIVTVGFYFGEQFIEVTAEAPATGRAKKDERNEGVAATKFDVQTIGAAWSYLRRYTLQAICGLASEDDDGNSLQADNKPIAKSANCPICGKDTIIKGKAEYGGGWLCYKAKGGCGAKFTVDPSGISHQPAGADARPQEAQPSTQQPSTSRPASQPQARPTKRIPPSPPEMLPRIVAFIKEVRFHPKKGSANARQSVFFESPLTGENQMQPWKCDYAICWHDSLFDLLHDSIGKECQLLIAERDKKLNNTDEWPTHFIDIEDVVAVTDPSTGEFVEYVDGKPVIEGGKQ